MISPMIAPGPIEEFVDCWRLSCNSSATIWVRITDPF